MAPLKSEGRLRNRRASIPTDPHQLLGSSDHASARPLVRLRLPRFRVVLWALFGMMVLVCAIDAVICALAPCPFREVGSRQAIAEGRCLEEIHLIMVFRVPSVLLCFIVVAVHAMYRIWLILGYQSHHLPRWVAVLLRLRPRADVWVAAASPDLFHETLQSLWSTNILVGSTLLPFFLVISSSSAFSISESLASSFEDPVINDQCQSVTLCYVSDACATSLTTINLWLLNLTTIPLHIMPPVVWGRTMELAMRKTSSLRVKRLLALPYLAGFGYLVCLLQIVHHQTRVIRHTASVGEMVLFFCAQVVTLCYWLAMLWLSLLPHDMASLIRRLTTPAGARSGNSIRPFPAQSAASEANTPSGIARAASAGSSDAPTGDCKFSSGYSSQRTELFLLACLVLWGMRAIARASLWKCAVIFACRGVALLVLFTTRDAPCDFEAIAREAGFGLLVDASALRKALRHLLDHKQQASIDKQRNGSSTVTLPRFKATLLRMQDTLAVSYRWQPEERALADGCSLNMSDYQIACLLDAIQRSRAKYVWLDRLSVPQEECGLKYTILARMMAVYAAARVTVAIRTVEADGSRYHQRAWTFQEFCGSCQLDIRTEQTGGHDSRRAVDGDEQARVEGLRARFQGSINDVVPFWLRQEGDLTAEEATALVAECRALGATLCCQVPGDKIRALLPLLAGTPVEGQGELISLVLRLARASGQDLQDWKNALLDQHMTLRRAKQKRCSDTGLAPDASTSCLMPSRRVSRASFAWEDVDSFDIQPSVPSYSALKATLSAGRADQRRRSLHSCFELEPEAEEPKERSERARRSLQRSHSTIAIGTTLGQRCDMPSEKDREAGSMEFDDSAMGEAGSWRSWRLNSIWGMARSIRLTSDTGLKLMHRKSHDATEGLVFTLRTRLSVASQSASHPVLPVSLHTPPSPFATWSDGIPVVDGPLEGLVPWRGGSARAPRLPHIPSGLLLDIIDADEEETEAR